MTLKDRLFLTPREVAAIFRHDGDLRYIYRHARPGGKLAPAAVRFGKELLFRREEIEILTGPQSNA